MLGLKERIYHKPNGLSGGQQQRVAIAQAFVGKLTILLADEPTGALDVNSGKEVLKLFQNLNDMGNTIVMIKHDTNVAKHAAAWCGSWTVRYLRRSENPGLIRKGGSDFRPQSRAP